MHPPTHVYPDPLVLRAFFLPVFGTLQNFVPQPFTDLKLMCNYFSVIF